MKYIDHLVWEGYNIAIHSDVKNCVDNFLIKNLISEKSINKTINIYMIKKHKVVDNVKEERIKIKKQSYNIYVSNKADSPKGIIIEKF